MSVVLAETTKLGKLFHILSRARGASNYGTPRSFGVLKFSNDRFGAIPTPVPKRCLETKCYYSRNLLPRYSILYSCTKYKMATEEVLDDSKNESGIPRAVFVVRILSLTDNYFVT